MADEWPPNPLTWLQDWYASRCDGAWEHAFGVAIETLDNPGWSVEIDLKGTSLEGSTLERIAVNREHETDWFSFWATDDTFQAAGGPRQLTPMIATFRAMVEATSPSPPEPTEVADAADDEWAPLRHIGWVGTEGKLLLDNDLILMVMYRIRPGGTTDKHVSGYASDVICLDGRGMMSVGAERVPLHAGRHVRRPARHASRLWTDQEEMVVLVVVQTGA